MWHLTFGRRHKALTFAVLILAGLALGLVIDEPLLCALFGAVLAATTVYGDPQRTHRSPDPARNRRWGREW